MGELVTLAPAAGPTIPDAALENHIAILAKTGSGKSNAAKTVVEGLLDRGERVCVIDPTGTWYGLRLTPARKPSPYQIAIFGGAHGDLAITGNHGAALAEVVGTSATSAIIDTRAMTVGARTQFFTEFAETLLRKNSGALTLVIDEAHLFAPKGKVADPQSGKMVGAANNLVSLGRGIGLRIILISQRPAKVHNDCLAGVETLVAMRMLLPHDRAAVMDWVKEQADPVQGREIVASLPNLKTGEAWIWSPGLDLLERRRFPLVRTYDSGRPPPPGETGPALAPLDMATITERLQAVAADVLANDPRALKAEVARLTRELAKQPVVIPESHGKYAEAMRHLAEIGEQLATAEHERDMEALRADQAESRVAAALAALQGDTGRVPPPPSPRAVPTLAESRRADDRRARAMPEATDPGRRRAATPPRVDAGAVPQACGKALAALAAVYPSGLTEPQWATSAGYRRSGGTWGTYKSRLRTAGLIEEREGRFFATEAGAAAAGGVEPPPPPGPDLVRWWVTKLPSTGRMGEALIDAWPEWITREDLAARVDMAVGGGSFGTYLSRLSGPGLIERTPAGIRLTEEAMGR